MAIPLTPQNVNVQQANGVILVSWDPVVGVTNYSIQRSTDQVNYSVVASPVPSAFTDSTVDIGTQYWYQVASVGTGGTSAYSTPQSAIPTNPGSMSLLQIRTQAQQRADRVNSQFVTLSEWNMYINQSLHELYDLLTTCYEDYYIAAPYIFQTSGSSSQYTLPSDFFKLLGIDCGLDDSGNAWVTLKKFDFISRNRYVYPNITSTFLGVFNLQYRLLGNSIMFIPTPSANQYIRVWYIPRFVELLADTDIADFYNGWLEYVVVDAAIKALQKEESDVSVLMAQKQALKLRIEDSAMNRDAGQPDSVSDVRTWSERFGAYGGGGWDGSMGGV